MDKSTGDILSLVDKRLGVEVFKGPAARPEVLEDLSDTWSHGVESYRKVIGRFEVKNIRFLEQGPVKKVLRVESEFGASKLMQDYIMHGDLPWIEVKVTLNWQERFKLLKLRFPVNVRAEAAAWEIPYGYIEREMTGTEETGHSWVDVSGKTSASDELYGVSILNNGKYSFDVADGEIGLTVLRSPVYAHHEPVEPQVVEADYTFMDQGVQTFRYAIYPHQGDWRDAGTVRLAAEFNQLPEVIIETYHEGTLAQRMSFMRVDNEQIVISAVKQAEDSDDVIVRCYEAAGVRTRAQLEFTLWGKSIEAEFAPCEVKTFRISKDPGSAVVETSLLEELEVCTYYG
jgi:alpha-mannosidase